MVEAKIKKKLDAVYSDGMRSQVDIMADILNEALEDTRKTRIMYRCNLSHRQLKSYLKLLLGMRMLGLFSEKEENNAVLFKTTEKGRDFLSAYRNLKALMSSSSSMH